MKKFLDSYQVKLVARGPVFVGSGREIGKKEYIFLPQNKVGVMDINKLYGLVRIERKAKSFEQYMLSGYLSLEEWLRKEKLYEQAYKTCLRYSLDKGHTQLVKGTHTQIMECIKDVYGQPYIPGSSLKGMLRGVLATARILSDEKLCHKLREEVRRNLDEKTKRKRYLSVSSGRVEQNLFRLLRRPDTDTRDAVNDVLSGMTVSDSEPLSVRQLVLAQKVERKVDGEEKTLNLLRESLCPGTEIKFTITIDHSRCQEDKESILHGIEAFDRAYNENFLQEFQKIGLLRPPQVFVGGGSGFVGKTLVYPLMGKKEGVQSVVKIFANTGVSYRHKHKMDVQLGVSPHILKCSWYSGRTVQMGLCDFVIE